MMDSSSPQSLSADTVDALTIGAIVLDENEKIVLWNRWMENTSGRTKTDVLGSFFTETFPDLADSRIYQAVQDALRYGHPALISHSLHQSPFPLTRGNNRQRIGQSVQVTPLYSDGSRFCLIQINDMTFALERERVLRRQTVELREAQQRQLALLNGIAEMAWLKDETGRYLAVNQTFAESVGCSPDQLVGRTDFDIYPEEDAKRYLAEDHQIMESGGISRTEERRFESDGREHWVEKIKVAIIGPTGKVIGTAGTARDVTERKETEAQITSLNTELEQRVRRRTAELEHANEALLTSNMELERFAHAAAHDLQTPLRSIVGFTQLLQQELRGKMDERTDEWFTLVIENAKRLQVLIQDLLAYSRLDALPRPFEPTPLREIFDQVMITLSAPIEEAGAGVSCGDLPVVTVDRTQIAQLFQNLIENGIKYNRSEPPRVAVACEARGDEYIFSVADNGLGIAPKHHQRIFEIFRRLHNYSQIPGTGIGLTICHRIVERHGGRIWVESREGEGSTFYFTLPVEPKSD